MKWRNRHAIKVLGLLQARVSSSRLPGKVLMPILGKPMLLHQIERLQRAGEIEKLVVVTSEDVSDAPLVEMMAQRGIDYFRGSLDDVLDRYYQAAKHFQAEHVVRLTGDCPLADPEVVDRVVLAHLRNNNDYTANTLPPTYPDGLDVEVVRFQILKEAWEKARLASEREHVTLYILKHPKRFSLGNVTGKEDLSELRWTVDEPEDFYLVSEIYNELYAINRWFSTADVLDLLRRRPELAGINKQIVRNAG